MATSNHSDESNQSLFQHDEYLVDAYVHDMEMAHHFNYPIPRELFALCLLYLHRRFLLLDEDTMSTPLTLLFAVYGADELIVLERKMEDSIRSSDHSSTHPSVHRRYNLCLSKQCELLQDALICTDDASEKAAHQIMQRWRHHIDADAKSDALYLRRLQQILTAFHAETQSLATVEGEHNISQCSEYDVFLSILHHSINVQEFENDGRTRELRMTSNMLQTWHFLHLARSYMKEEHMNGAVLLSKLKEYARGGKVSGIGFGRVLLLGLRKRYGIKVGPYGRAKKQINLFTKELWRRAYGGDGGTAAEEEKEHDHWYWLKDEDMKWIPYNESQQKLMDVAMENAEQNIIITLLEGLKVALNTDCGHGLGYQCEFTTVEKRKRNVIRRRPGWNGLLHGLPCETEPQSPI